MQLLLLSCRSELLCQQKDTHYSIDTFIEIGKEKFPISDFSRHYFLLERDNCYYQVSPKSYEALDWICSQDASQWVLDQPDHFEAVLLKLAQWDVKIEKGDLAEAEMIVAEPQSQVMVSELSNTFLKLEPQFVYDGFTIEGPFEPVTKVDTPKKTVLVQRNKEKEEELVHFLQSLHEKFSGQHNGFFYLSFAEAQKKGWFLKTYHLLLDKNIDLLGIDLLKHFRYSPHKPLTTLHKQTWEGDFACIEISVKFGKEDVP
ncbi:hypothetical protein LWM68_29450 [Niabella sp. W65]|nr:hypothetical protein [Niabella sp. W65]MCH7366533.1 hypothetical protein [Niabella sp. W65]